MYRIFPATWQSSLVGGWCAFSGNTNYYWEKTLGGGFWDTRYDYFISDSASGCGYISGYITFQKTIRLFCYTEGCGYIHSRYNLGRYKAVYPELRFNDSYDDSDCPIAALEFTGFEPNNIINVISYENDIYENTEAFNTIETLTRNDAVFPLKHYHYSDIISGELDLLVTNLTSSIHGTRPLFFQYELLYDASFEEKDSLTVYKNNEIIVDKDDYYIQYSYDLIADSGRYSQTEWKQINNNKKVHRVRLLFPIDFYNSGACYVVTYNKYINGAVTQQKELIDLVPIYKRGIDYDITLSGIVLTPTSNINSTTEILYVIKNPCSRIYPIGIEPPVYEPDGISSWRIRINPGLIYVPSGYLTGNEVAYKISNSYITEPYPVTNIIPTFVSNDIIKVDQTPIYIDPDKYKYPLYEIDIYDRSSLQLVEPSGKIGISVNGRSVPGLKIISIDTKNGFIQLNKSLSSMDRVELDFYVNPTGHLIVTNLELNPKNTGVLLFNIVDYKNGLGLAMRPYDKNNPDTELIYLYDASSDESTRVCYSIPPVGGTSTAVAWNDETFAKICELHINKLSKDAVKVTDARRISSIEDKALTEYFNSLNQNDINLHEKEWYTDIGYYDGEPLAFGNTIIIHIPSGIFFGARNQWIEEARRYIDDDAKAIEKGTKDFNFYLDQVIKRYISAGTNYVIIPVDSSGNFMDIVRLDY